MQQIITAKLKLLTTPEQFAQLRQTQLAYRDALNYVSQYAFAHGKTSNKVGLQEGTYHDIRVLYGITGQMACSVPRQVGATYKALWTKAKQNAQARKDGRTKKRYKGLDQVPKYVSSTLSCVYGHDYTFKKDQHVSIATLKGRVKVAYQGYNKHVALLQEGAKIGEAKLYYDKPRKQFYLIVSLEVEIADPTPENYTNVVGVDVGVRYLATTTDTRNHTHFYSGKRIVAKAEHYHRLRKRLQRKGTRSAIRRLIALSGRERRFKRDVNHSLASHILATHSHSLIGLEHLTGIREDMKRRKGKRASKKQRKANRRASSWAFAELHTMLAYKAPFQSSMTVKMDADYTSQMCPKCGNTTKKNRPNGAIMFCCTMCSYECHSDLVGARNITMRTLLIRQDWMRTGILSVSLDVSNCEAKAERLQKYSELRWSSETSFRV
jgi:IS605 OrfB family transposase